MESRLSERTIKQNIVSTCIQIFNLPQAEQAGAGLLDWMLTQIKTDEPVYLLAHFDDGVVWGRREQSKWVTSYDDFSICSPLPRDLTLQQARAFHESGELHVWRDGENEFHAAQMIDTPVTEGVTASEYLDEPQILWGDTAEGNPINGFQLWREGSQGLYHAMPVTTYRLPEQKAKQENNQVKLPPLLVLRHYLASDPDDPAARIAHSRLVGFSEEIYEFKEESSDTQGEADAQEPEEDGTATANTEVANTEVEDSGEMTS